MFHVNFSRTLAITLTRFTQNPTILDTISCIDRRVGNCLTIEDTSSVPTIEDRCGVCLLGRRLLWVNKFVWGDRDWVQTVLLRWAAHVLVPDQGFFLCFTSLVTISLLRGETNQLVITKLFWFKLRWFAFRLIVKHRVVPNWPLLWTVKDTTLVFIRSQVLGELESEMMSLSCIHPWDSLWWATEEAAWRTLHTYRLCKEARHLFAYI